MVRTQLNLIERCKIKITRASFQEIGILVSCSRLIRPSSWEILKFNHSNVTKRSSEKSLRVSISKQATKTMNLLPPRKAQLDLKVQIQPTEDNWPPKKAKKASDLSWPTSSSSTKASLWLLQEKLMQFPILVETSIKKK